MAHLKKSWKEIFIGTDNVSNPSNFTCEEGLNRAKHEDR